MLGSVWSLSIDAAERARRRDPEPGAAAPQHAAGERGGGPSSCRSEAMPRPRPRIRRTLPRASLSRGKRVLQRGSARGGGSKTGPRATDAGLTRPPTSRATDAREQDSPVVLANPARRAAPGTASRSGLGPAQPRSPSPGRAPWLITQSCLSSPPLKIYDPYFPAWVDSTGQNEHAQLHDKAAGLG